MKFLLYELKSDFAKRMENLVIAVAMWLPRRLVYWCAIRVMVHRHDGSPADRTCAEALKGWD